MEGKPFYSHIEWRALGKSCGICNVTYKQTVNGLSRLLIEPSDRPDMTNH